jgi:hypothetical protein
MCSFVLLVCLVYRSSIISEQLPNIFEVIPSAAPGCPGGIPDCAHILAKVFVSLGFWAEMGPGNRGERWASLRVLLKLTDCLINGADLFGMTAIEFLSGHR